MYSHGQYRHEYDRLRAEIENNRTPEQRQRADELRAQRAAYDALPGDAKKEMNELQVFRAFAKVAPIRIDDNLDRSVAPPEPDICCSIDGLPYYFELAEITDQGVARSHSIALKTVEQDDKEVRNRGRAGGPVAVLPQTVSTLGAIFRRHGQRERIGSPCCTEAEWWTI